MAPDKFRHIETVKHIPLGGRLALIAELGHRVDAARAADEYLALVLRIEVDKVFARQHTLAESESTRQTRLLVDGEQSLQRSVLRLGVDHHGQRRRHAYAAVGAERRPLGTHPTSLDAGADRVGLEIEIHVRILFAHHIHVRLEDNRRSILATRRRRTTHDHVAYSVALALYPVATGELHEILYDPPLFLRRTRHARNAVELLPHRAWFQISDCHNQLYISMF